MSNLSEKAPVYLPGSGGRNQSGEYPPQSHIDPREILEEIELEKIRLQRAVAQFNANQQRLRMQQNVYDYGQYRPRLSLRIDPIYILILFAGLFSAILMAIEGFQSPVLYSAIGTGIVMVSAWASRRGGL